MKAFLVFVIFISAVSAIKKNNHAGSLSVKFVFADLFLDISRRFTKLHFKSGIKNLPTISLYFLELTVKVLRDNYAKRH